MESKVFDGATQERMNETGFDRGAAVTRSLLGYGMLAGPFYLAVGLAQAFVRDGFDFQRHPLSVLANGPGGWIQTANLVLTGLMVIAAAVGIARMPAPKLRAASWFLGAFGASMIIAGIFPADPMDGFPLGTPIGPPTSITTTGFVHFAAGALGFVSLGVSCFAAALVMSRRNEPTMSRLSVFSSLAVVIGFFGGAALSSTPLMILGIWFAVVVGWTWLAVLSRHLYRVSPSPHCAPQSR